jgi:hypothetical protein
MRELPNSHFAAIGKVVDAWATLEFFINKSIWELMNVEQKTGACVTAQIGSIQQRMKALTSLIALYGGDEALIKDLNRFADSAAGLARQRNRVAHDPWWIQEKTNIVNQFVSTAEKKVDFGFKPVPEEYLLRLGSKIHSAHQEFTDLFNRALSSLPPSDRTRFEQSDGIRATPRPNPNS